MLITFFCFVHANIKKNPSRVEYFSKIAEILSTAQTTQSVQRQQKQKQNINLSFYSTYLGYITLKGRPKTRQDKTTSWGSQSLKAIKD